MGKGRQRIVKLFITLKDAQQSANIQPDHIQYIVDRLRKEKKVIVLNAKEALRFYPGVWKMNDGSEIMAVKVECLIGPYATFE